MRVATLDIATVSNLRTTRVHICAYVYTHSITEDGHADMYGTVQVTEPSDTKINVCEILYFVNTRDSCLQNAMKKSLEKIIFLNAYSLA